MSSRFAFPGNKNYVWLKQFALLEQTNGKGSGWYVKLCQQHNEMYHADKMAITYVTLYTLVLLHETVSVLSESHAPKNQC